jgi:hypothetical protein
MPCGVQRSQTQPFWGPPGEAKSGSDAHLVAIARLNRLAAQWAKDMEKALTCPEGCTNPHAFHYSVEELAADGYYSWRSGVCIFHIRARLHCQWVCDPVGGRPAAEPEPELPGNIVVYAGPSGPIPTGPTLAPEPIDTGKCDVTIEMQDQSSMSTIGVYDWTIDLSFEAMRSNKSHQMVSCTVKEVVMRQRHGTGHSVADSILNLISSVIPGQEHDLTNGSYGLTIISGIGQATINGILRAGSGLPLNGASAPVIYVTIEAVDSNFDHEVRIFPILPKP